MYFTDPRDIERSGDMVVDRQVLQNYKVGNKAIVNDYNNKPL